MHQTFSNFLKSIQQSIGGTSGILIQFPLYFGIMGIMTESGLVEIMSNFFVSISNEKTFPILTFASAGIIYIFLFQVVVDNGQYKDLLLLKLYRLQASK